MLGHLEETLDALKMILMSLDMFHLKNLDAIQLPVMRMEHKSQLLWMDKINNVPKKIKS